VLYDSIDHFSHMFMEYHPPQQSHLLDTDFETYQHVIAACYRFHDLMLGRLLQLAGEDATVLIVSDHGFRTGNDRLQETVRSLEGLSQWHRDPGICVLQGPHIRPGVQLKGASLLDVTPTILSLFGLPVGADMDGRPWLEVFEGAAEPDRVASWDEVPGEAGMHPAELRQKPVESHEAIRHLIELGYLEPPDADVEQAIEVCLATNQYNLGRALLNAGLANEAIAILKPLVERHPETSEFSKALGKAQRAVCNTKLVHPPSPSPSPGPGEGF
jgi:hypothetical protein